MIDKVFLNFPDEARIWIHGFKTPLNHQQKEIVTRVLGSFVPKWQTHGKPVTADYLILQDRFVITAAYCHGGVSGCSIDSFFRNFKQLRDESGLDGLDGSLIFYRDSGGNLQATDHLSFYDVVDSGQIKPETVVYDTLIGTLGELRKGRFEISFSEAWHARTYPLPQSAIAQ